MSSSRPRTERPVTSLRTPMTSGTGLMAPKSSRGKTALQRQIQDKSYFIGLLRSKINEINAERNVLLREFEIMSKEEARYSIYKQKAETLAKELDELSLELATYNEFVDRVQLGDDASSVREDTSRLKHSNMALAADVSTDINLAES